MIGEDTGRDDDILVFLHGILFTEDTIPSFSLRTINKHGVVTAMFFLEKMIFNTWEETYLAYI